MLGTVLSKIFIEGKFPRISLILLSSSFSNVLKEVEYQILDDYFQMLISNDTCKLDLISKYPADQSMIDNSI